MFGEQINLVKRLCAQNLKQRSKQNTNFKSIAEIQSAMITEVFTNWHWYLIKSSKWDQGFRKCKKCGSLLHVERKYPVYLLKPLNHTLKRSVKLLSLLNTPIVTFTDWTDKQCKYFAQNLSTLQPYCMFPTEQEKRSQTPNSDIFSKSCPGLFFACYVIFSLCCFTSIENSNIFAWGDWFDQTIKSMFLSENFCFTLAVFTMAVVNLHVPARQGGPCIWPMGEVVPLCHWPAACTNEMCKLLAVLNFDSLAGAHKPNVCIGYWGSHPWCQHQNLILNPELENLMSVPNRTTKKHYQLQTLQMKMCKMFECLVSTFGEEILCAVCHDHWSVHKLGLIFPSVFKVGSRFSSLWETQSCLACWTTWCVCPNAWMISHSISDLRRWNVKFVEHSNFDIQ